MLVEFAERRRGGAVRRRGATRRCSTATPRSPTRGASRSASGSTSVTSLSRNEDIFGDGVNIAARLEALAELDGICISRTLRDQVRDKLPYRFEDTGSRPSRTSSTPARLRIGPECVTDLPASGKPTATSISPRAAAPRLSIVVLPFTNLSDDREQQYFADGITEDLTTDLSRIADSFVISRNSAFTYRGQDGRHQAGRP